jgi:hypothetical protein
MKLAQGRPMCSTKIVGNRIAVTGLKHVHFGFLTVVNSSFQSNPVNFFQSFTICEILERAQMPRLCHFMAFHNLAY